MTDWCKSKRSSLPGWVRCRLKQSSTGMTMQLHLQRHCGDDSGGRTARRDRRITPTTRRRHPSCRRSALRFAARWLSRDPINEIGFKVQTNYRRLPFGPDEEKNLYGFVLNNPVSIVDPFGLWQWGWPPWGNKTKKCCKPDDEGTKAAKELTKHALEGLVSNLADAAEEAGSEAARSLGVLQKSMLLIGAAQSICDAKNPDGCDDFLSSGEIDACMICCTSIHTLFSNELGGVGFLISCKHACENAD